MNSLVSDPLLIAVAICIVCVTVSIPLAVYLCYRQTISSPQHKCLHDMETIEIFHGTRSNEYLSTCKKCGYQKTHHACGLNGA